MVGTRNCTKVVDGVVEQVGIVREATGDHAPIHGTPCFGIAACPVPALGVFAALTRGAPAAT